ncbi:hypothetical protein B0T19DRAFT_432841 [Cercophora scortea]|uniref:DUF7708 domain-containing protein n=1 Tax=Cercophora scortea TaxID=314031 RepID=A0AAE0I7A2_9PEZI|nr:hypothetical protein B0T19DRAFT_432841 [Cercophora scortea]
MAQEQGYDAMLREGVVVKQGVAELTSTFATIPDSPLDGSPHQALQPPRALGVATASTQAGAKPVQHCAVEVQVEEEEDKFKAAIREYEGAAEPKYKTGVNPDDTHSIEQLWKIIDDEIETYQSKDKKGAWGKVRLAFRKLGDGSEAVQGWLGLLPTESEYMSVICGGLKLIIQAAARMRNVAEKVLDALCQIPIILSGTRRVLSIFQESQELQKCSRALYKSVLLGLGHMLEYLRRKSAWKVLKAGFKQQSFESGLVDKIDDITKQRDAFNDEAELCHKEVVHRLEKASEKSGNEIKDEMRAISVIISAARAEEERARRAIADGLHLVAMRVGELGREVASLRGDLDSKLYRPFQQLMKLLSTNPMAEDYVRLLRKQLDAPEETVPDQRVQRRSSALSVKTKKSSQKSTRRALLAQLNYDPTTATTDLLANYSLGHTLSSDDQERGLHVIKSPQLAAWVEATSSTALLINGNAPAGAARRSALSFVCARLVYVLHQIRSPPNTSSSSSSSDTSTAERPDIIPLHFFCGSHLSRDEESWASPAGIVNSLLAQLFTCTGQTHLAADKTAREGSDSPFDPTDVEEVFARFNRAYKQLPTTAVVFCVVDGVSFFVDDDETAQDAVWLVEKLVGLAGRRKKKKKKKERAAFKLLITAPTRLRVDGEFVGGADVLVVPREVQDTGGFTAMRWSSGVGRQLAGLARAEGS